MAKRFDWLCKNPGAGRLRTEIGEGYRSYRQGSHLIFYIDDCGSAWKSDPVSGVIGVE
jgi:plasmid stabilization system protein ParE